MPASAARVAYVAYAFPVLTQTFTVRETAALRLRGLDLHVFSAKRGDAASYDPMAQNEAARATYLPGPLSIRALGAALGWVLRRPIRFLATLTACLGGTYRDDGWRCRVRAPLHVVLGAALASTIETRGGFTRIHAQFVDAGSTVAFVAARLLDVPFSFANHTAYNPFLLELKCRHADIIVSITEYDRSLLIAQSRGAATPSRVVVSRVGIDTAAWQHLERRPEPGRILIVGALREKKGHAVLVRAAGLLRQRGTTARLVFAGAGPEESRLRELASSLGVDVEYLGAVGPERVREELVRAAVFALPCVVASNGDIDGIPVALMEAMAARVPVVSTRLSGIPELIDDGVSGLLVPPGDAAALAESLARLLNAPDAATSIALAAARRVASLHELDSTSARLASILAGAAT